MMKKIYEIRLPKVLDEDLLTFFIGRFGKTTDQFNYYISYNSPFSLVDNSAKLFSMREYGLCILDKRDHRVGLINFEHYDKTTIIIFQFDVEIKKAPILEYIEFIERELRLCGFTIVHSQEGDNSRRINSAQSKIHLPKTQKGLELWKRIYVVISEMRQKGLDDYEIFIPKLVDYQDRIKLELGIERTTRTISDIIKAGDAGYLD